MKLNNIVLNANDFANEMAKLRNEKHFDFLVTIIGEDVWGRRVRVYLYFGEHSNL